jgi:hypothetical protein
MQWSRFVLIISAAAAGLALAGNGAQAAKFKTLHSFCTSPHLKCNDGSNPQSGMAMDSAGNFYGTTSTGGFGYGTVFELEKNDEGHFKYKTIYHFCDSRCGRYPTGVLTIDTQGNLYGTTRDLVFELSPRQDTKKWAEKVLYGFCGQSCGTGLIPVGGLTYAGQENGALYDGISPLYGVTNSGGVNNAGVVFDLALVSGHWTESVLYNFCSVGANCLDGGLPIAGLTIDGTGTLYGTTEIGGGNDLGENGGGTGVVFALVQSGGSWSETVLHSFCSAYKCTDGGYPQARLAWDTNGDLLGTTAAGGSQCGINGIYGCGVIFKLANQGQNSIETVLHTFCEKGDCKDGAEPNAALTLDSDGNIFGTAQRGGRNNTDQLNQGGGVVFELSAGSYKVLHSFCSLANCADGEYPEGELTSGPAGVLLGATRLGGTADLVGDGGTIFQVGSKH